MTAVTPEIMRVHECIWFHSKACDTPFVKMKY